MGQVQDPGLQVCSELHVSDDLHGAELEVCGELEVEVQVQVPAHEEVQVEVLAEVPVPAIEGVVHESIELGVH